MRAVLVIDPLEACQLLVQGSARRRGWLGRQPFLECLVEPLDFSLSLPVVRRTVLLDDPQLFQQVSKSVRAAFAVRETGRVDHAVIGQGGGRIPVVPCRASEGIGDGDPSNSAVSADVEEIAGAVIEPGDDLGVGALAQGPVGEVGLPGLVGLGCFSA